MPQYSGITTNPSRRLREHAQHFVGIHIVKVRQFPSRVAAQRWENNRPGSHHPGGRPAHNPRARVFRATPFIMPVASDT